VSDQSDQHSIAGISCEKYGGPEDASEMVYWSDITSDASFESPFHAKHDQGDRPMYMTFEPDGGGWNNIRMAMETVVVMAHAMGRTLVIPPGQGMYLLRKVCIFKYLCLLSCHVWKRFLCRNDMVHFKF